MPAEEKTPLLGLNRWKGNEYVKCADFVSDNDAIDEVINYFAFADLSIMALYKNMKYFYEKTGNVHTEIIGLSKDDDYYMKRVSVKTETGWLIKLDNKRFNKSLSYKKLLNGWEVSV